MVACLVTLTVVSYWSAVVVCYIFHVMTGMGEEIDISQRITVSHPDRSVSPPYSQGRAVTPPAEDRAPSTGTSGPSGEPPASFVRLGPDEVVIKKAVLRGIKRGAELALEGCVPAAFSIGLASAGDVPFAIPKPSKDKVHGTFCRKDFPSAKALRWHLHMHAESLCTCVQGVDGIWRAGPLWRCTSNLVAPRTVPTTVCPVGRAITPSKPCCSI